MEYPFDERHGRQPQRVGGTFGVKRAPGPGLGVGRGGSHPTRTKCVRVAGIPRHTLCGRQFLVWLAGLTSSTISKQGLPLPGVKNVSGMKIEKEE